jgi:hypothetical protein
MNRGRVGEERGGKETDRYPLTTIVNSLCNSSPYKCLCMHIVRAMLGTTLNQESKSRE